MLNYWSGKLGELEFLKMCWIDFGCPGHGARRRPSHPARQTRPRSRCSLDRGATPAAGKGPWDGLGEEWTPPDGGGFVINATELRSVNFTMTPTTPPPPQLEQVRRSGRRAAVVSAPPPPKPPTEFTMARAVDDDIRSKCW